jgi:hypothetical protein
MFWPLMCIWFCYDVTDNLQRLLWFGFLLITLYIYSYSCSSALKSIRSQHNVQWKFKIDKWRTVDCFSLAPLKKLDSLDFSVPCRAANDFPILANAANDFTVSHETNSLPGNKMYLCGVPQEVFTSIHFYKQSSVSEKYFFFLLNSWQVQQTVYTSKSNSSVCLLFRYLNKFSNFLCF